MVYSLKFILVTSLGIFGIFWGGSSKDLKRVVSTGFLSRRNTASQQGVRCASVLAAQSAQLPLSAGGLLVETMVGLVDASTGVEDLPPGMRYYTFMFGDQQPDVSEHLAAGKVPPPSSLLIGLGVGAALTLLRMLLDFAVFKVG